VRGCATRTPSTPTRAYDREADGNGSQTRASQAPSPRSPAAGGESFSADPSPFT